MKNIKNLRLRIITIITLTVYMIALMPINSVGAFETPEFEKVMSLDEMNQDLDLIVKNIGINYKNISEEQKNMIKKSQELIKSPKRVIDFYFIWKQNYKCDCINYRYF